MSDLIVRRIPWDFTDVSVIWNPENPDWSVNVIGLSFAAVGFERLLCKAFRQAGPLITDPELRAENDLFIQQEAVHSQAADMHLAPKGAE